MSHEPHTITNAAEALRRGEVSIRLTEGPGSRDHGVGRSGPLDALARKFEWQQRSRHYVARKILNAGSARSRVSVTSASVCAADTYQIPRRATQTPSSMRAAARRPYRPG